MSLGPFQILVIALVILVLFGRGRISAMMGDIGKGVTSFRKGLAADEAAPSRLDSPEALPAAETVSADKAGG